MQMIWDMAALCAHTLYRKSPPQQRQRQTGVRRGGQAHACTRTTSLRTAEMLLGCDRVPLTESHNIGANRLKVDHSALVPNLSRFTTLADHSLTRYAARSSMATC